MVRRLVGARSRFLRCFDFCMLNVGCSQRPTGIAGNPAERRDKPHYRRGLASWPLAPTHGRPRSQVRRLVLASARRGYSVAVAAGCGCDRYDSAPTTSRSQPSRSVNIVRLRSGQLDGLTGGNLFGYADAWQRKRLPGSTAGWSTSELRHFLLVNLARALAAFVALLARVTVGARPQGDPRGRGRRARPGQEHVRLHLQLSIAAGTRRDRRLHARDNISIISPANF